MKWTTSITDVGNGRELIRGYRLDDLISKKNFVEVIFLILRGELPSKQETRMFNALLVACIDHGVAVASAQSARLSASTGNSLHTSLAAGILGFGSRHGGAAQGAAEFFHEYKECVDVDALVASLRENKKRIPGFGHKVLEVDHRAEKLLTIAKECGFFGRHCAFAREVAEALARVSSKKLPLNIDGAIAAILLDMEFDPSLANGLFLIGRVPGLVAHIHEEMTSGAGLRRLSEVECEYTGAPERTL